MKKKHSRYEYKVGTCTRFRFPRGGKF